MANSQTLPTFDYAQRLPGSFRFPARMSLLPLGQGEVALISPIPIDDALAERIAEHGRVRFLIAPNLLHHFYLGAAIARYPAARVLGPARLREKRPELTIHQTFEQALPPELTRAVDVVRIDAGAKVDEVAFYHRATRTLVVTDLLFNIERPQGFMANLVLWAVGCRGCLATSRAARWLYRQGPHLTRGVEQLLSFPFETLVMAHGAIVHEQARERAAEALSWARSKRQLLTSETSARR